MQAIHRRVLVVTVLAVWLVVPVPPAGAADQNTTLQAPSLLDIGDDSHALTGNICANGGPTMQLQVDGPPGARIMPKTFWVKTPLKVGTAWYVGEISYLDGGFGTSKGANRSWSVGASPGIGDDFGLQLQIAIYVAFTGPCDRGQSVPLCVLKTWIYAKGHYAGDPTALAANDVLTVSGKGTATEETVNGSCTEAALVHLKGVVPFANLEAKA